MCYGSKQQVSNIVKKYVRREGGVDWVIGRDFWEFISGDLGCIDEIFQIIGEVGDNFQDEKGQSLREIIAEKTEELTEQFIETYGTATESIWDKLLERNS